jgi:hypothetical protein
VLVPAPLPTYTLSPGMPPLSGGQQAALEACLSALTGRLTGVLVTSASTTASHHLIELITPAGTLLAMERVDAPPRAAGHGGAAAA